MRIALRSLGVVVVALIATMVLAFSSVSTWLVLPMAATTALIMGGAGHSLRTPPDDLEFVDAYTGLAVDHYINPVTPGGADNRVVVITPEARLLGVGFDPLFSLNGLFDITYDQSVAEGQINLHNCINGSRCNYNVDASTGAPQPGESFVVYGYSQSSTIATFEKRALAAEYPDGVGSPTVSFVLVSNGNRPNGGILSRNPQGFTIPIVGVTSSGPTPTDTIYPTIDISRQYDGWSDQPTNLLNVLAMLNVAFGAYYLHPNYDSVDFSDAQLQDVYGDTSYYLIPTPILPLLMPLEQIPVVGSPLADTLDPVLRVMVEAGYDRTTSPGQPSTWNLLYFPNPVEFSRNLVVAFPTGLDNGIEDITGTRPLGTERPGPYGVGGPPVTMDPTSNEQAAEQLGTPSQIAGQELNNNSDPEDPPAPAPGDDMTTVKESRFNDWESATGSSAAVERKPWRPSVRSPIGSNLPNLSNLATVMATRPDTDGPAKKLLKGLADLGKDADTKPEVTRPSADP